MWSDCLQPEYRHQLLGIPWFKNASFEHSLSNMNFCSNGVWRAMDVVRLGPGEAVLKADGAEWTGFVEGH